MTAWHEYPMNYSNGTSVQNLTSLLQYTNSQVNDSLGIIILAAVGLITFLSVKATTTAIRALAAATFFSFIISIFLMRLALVSISIPIVLAGAVVIVGLMLRSDANQGL